MHTPTPKTREEQCEAWWKRNTKWVVMGIFAFILLWIAISFLLSPPRWLTDHEPDGSIGDYFNGLLGPFIALIAAIGTFAAFIVQYQANQAQKAALKEQSNQFLHDRFEQRFMEMIKMHRENVPRLNYYIPGIGTFKGTEALEGISIEIELSNHTVRNIFEFVNPSISHDEIFKRAISVVFFGLDEKGKAWSIVPSVENQTIKDDWIEALTFLKDIPIYQNKETTNFPFETWQLEIIEERLSYVKDYCPSFGIERTNPLNIVPWRGQHQSLSPYLRHLNLMYQMIDDAVSGASPILTVDQAKFYADFLRSQLSIEEQKLLFYLSLTEVLNHWWQNKWMEEDGYNPIKDLLPKDLPAGLDLEALKQQMRTTPS